MNKHFKITMASAALTLSSLAMATPAVLNTGLIKMGVGDNGGLGQGTSTGLIGPTGDAITPGCLCEGWGASAGTNAGWTDGSAGTYGLTSATLTTTVASGTGLAAQSKVVMSNGLQVTHTYSYAAAGKLFKVQVALTNTTADSLSDVRYARTLDWDVTPGYYDDNYTTIYGGTPTGPGGKVLTTSSDPFAAADPLTFRNANKDQNIVDSRGDQGSFFVFGFGSLLSGATQTFDTFIGADTTVAGLLTALGSVGVEAYSYTTGNSIGSDGKRGPAYGYGFVGLDLAPSLPDSTVPEPSSIALAGLALVAGGMARRRRA